MKNEIVKNLSSLHRYSKRSIAIITDVGLCVMCTWLAFGLRLEELILFKDFNFSPILISIILAISVFWIFGLYRTIFRYSGISLTFTILVSTSVYGFLYFLIIGIYGISGVPRSIGIIQPMLLFFGVLSSRLLVKYLMSGNKNSKNKSSYKKKVLIYGAGTAGRQLVIALENSTEYKVRGFLDDNSQLHKQVLLGQPIHDPSKLNSLIKNQDISIVLLALPSIGRNRRNKIISKLNKFKLIVKTLPSIEEVVEGKITISDIKDLNIDDLLDREKVNPNFKLLAKNIYKKVVLVTGSGGSIGSEICRQIIKLEPKKLILLELNEFALYKIFEDLQSYPKKLDIIPILANVQDEKKLSMIFRIFKVDTVYHAAAYKHVPLVEENICEGVKNNVFGTLAIAKSVVNQNVSNLVLISSDKAVRPTNIMGATKRLAELCMQAIFEDIKDKNVKFSIVRFGNVLESSGSVIPKFKSQIKQGGPVTLTHEDVTRYFMTVTEAAQLVIQAGAMSESCEVFVLDMGQSVKIKDLIYKMINLSGFTVKDEKNPDGDIEIKIIGLRPGEKLYEELLIGDDPQITNHPKIQKTKENYISFSQLNIDLKNLETLLYNNDANEIKTLLSKLIRLYKSNSDLVDHIHKEKLVSQTYKDKTFSKKIEKGKVVKIK